MWRRNLFFLLREFEQALPQPLELPAEAFEVGRTLDLDRLRETALAQL